MEKIAVTCLGSGAALGFWRSWNSLLIDGTILLELPPTTVPQLFRLHVDPRAIRHVFISHLHGDAYFGFPFFLLLYCYLYEREEPLYVIGPRGIQKSVEMLFDLAWPGLRAGGVIPRVPIVFCELSHDGRVRAGDLCFEAVKMEHFSLDAFGFRFSSRGRTVAFTGDTGDCPQLERLTGGADLVITEFTETCDEGSEGHLGAAAISRLVRRLRQDGGTVLATHLGGEPPSIDGLVVARDGETYLF
jgi:ribonuclease BN (tRNA processing enzyme)